MQRPRGMREKGAFGELQKVQPGWEFEGGMRLEVTEGRGGSGGGMHKACCSGNQEAKLHGILLQLAAPKAPKVSQLGWESKPLEALSLLRKEDMPPEFRTCFFNLSLFKRINCHLPTQSGCSLPWPQSSCPQTHYPASSCPDQP